MECDGGDRDLSDALGKVSRAATLYSHKTGLPLNPDPAVRDYVLRGLARNLLAHGRAYCPCREVTGNTEADRINICPCRTHRREVEESGTCECGLYIAPGLVEQLTPEE